MYGFVSAKQHIKHAPGGVPPLGFGSFASLKSFHVQPVSLAAVPASQLRAFMGTSQTINALVIDRRKKPRHFRRLALEGK